MTFPRPPGIRRRSRLVSSVYVGATLLLLITAAFAWPHRQRLPHYNNSARARSLKVGMTRAEVTDLLGDPEREQSGTCFFNPSPNGRTIRVDFDGGRVRSFDPGID